MTRPPELQAIIDAIEQGGPYESVEEVNRILAARMREYNSRPQRELGGLSPDEMGQLLYGDWTSEGALRLTESLSLDELAGAAILSDAHTGRAESVPRGGWTRRATGKQRTGLDTSHSVTACWIPSCTSSCSKSDFFRPKSNSSSERSVDARRSTTGSCGSSSPSVRGMIRF